MLFNNKKIKVTLLIMFILVSFLNSINNIAYAATLSGVVATDALNVRTGPGVEYDSKGLLYMGEEVTINKSEKAKDGVVWYQITSARLSGFVSSEYISTSVESEGNYTPDMDFEKYLTEQGFPESYKKPLRLLHEKYPNWEFKSAKTNLNWDNVIKKESKNGISLVYSGAPDSWKSMEKGAYDFDTKKYIVYDSGGWITASEKIVRYYMDPRNFLNENNIFQFLTHSYESKTQTKSGIEKLVKGTFLSNDFPESTYKKYSDAILDAGKKANVNPYVLSSMILIEQGKDGKGNCISGKVKGYEGYYNYFNIGAYQTSTMDAVERGLWYASGSGSYGRPWNSRAKSILGGALFYNQNYVSQNKNTLYFKKFNVMNGMSNVGTGQYMTNIQGAYSEALELKKGYADMMSDDMTFVIPVYNNMPEKASAMPGNGNNNNYLTSINVEGYELTPEFDRYKSEYEVVVPYNVGSVNITTKKSDSNATIKGSGKIALKEKNTKVELVVTSTSGETRKYIVNIAREDEPIISGSKPEISSNIYVLDKDIKNVKTNTELTTFLSNITVKNGKICVYDKDNDIVTDGIIKTGMKLVLTDTNNKEIASYGIPIKGDVNGDGKINSADALAIQKHIVKSRIVDGLYLTSSDINDDKKINSVDALYVQKHIVGNLNIEG